MDSLQTDALFWFPPKQLTVLCSFILCLDQYHRKRNEEILLIGKDETVGDQINILKVVKELENQVKITRGVVNSLSCHRIILPHECLHRGMRYFSKNCLKRAIDKEFFLQVASKGSLQLYAFEYFGGAGDSKMTKDDGLLSLMRIILNGRIGEILPFTTGLVPLQLVYNVEEFVDFIQKWSVHNVSDPTSWADSVSLERTKSFYSAYTILKRNRKETYLQTGSPVCERYLLYCVLLSDGCKISMDNDDWFKQLTSIVEKFFKNDNTPEKAEVISNLDEMIRKGMLIEADRFVTFNTCETKHWAFGDFVINCLRTNRDYEKFLKMTSRDFLTECCKFWRYGNSGEICLFIPEQLEDCLIDRLEYWSLALSYAGWLNVLHSQETQDKDMQLKKKIITKVKLPFDVFNYDDDTRTRFVQFVKYEVETEKEGTTKNTMLSSLFGSFLIGHQTDTQDSQKQICCTGVKWNILLCILMAEDYKISLNTTWSNRLLHIQENFTSFETPLEVMEHLCIEELKDDKLLTVENKMVTFASDNIRHEVMGAFILKSLRTDKDYENYFRSTSPDSLMEYVRPWWHIKSENYRNLYVPEDLNKALIEGLGLDAILHDIAAKERGYRRRITRMLGLPDNLFNLNRDTRTKFVQFFKRKSEVRVQRNLYRFLGSFLIGRKTSNVSEACLNERSVPTKKWNILISVLVSENYTISTHNMRNLNNVAKIFRIFKNDWTKHTLTHFLKELIFKDKVLKFHRQMLTFASDSVRHQVMSYFVLNCLQTNNDYENYFNLSSSDSLLEYVRLWGYEIKEEDRCVFIPRTFRSSLIRGMGLDAVKHVMVEDDKYEDREKFISALQRILKLPGEILYWDIDSRCRYVDCAKKGTQTFHRARAMIVGCAGAGKTTLLMRLQRRALDEIKQVQSTVALEVYEDIFELSEDGKNLKVLSEKEDKEGKKLLSVLDFAGQCAYYACHQVYLSRRAFYLLVIDKSKPFDEKLDPSLCDQKGTMFADWTYGEYTLFWLKSVHTYCDDDTPVIVVATHCDGNETKKGFSICDQILHLLKTEPELKRHLSRDRCFCIGFPLDGPGSIVEVSEIEKCIFSIANGERWIESIPEDWAYCETVLRAERLKGKKIISKTDLQNITSLFHKKYGIEDVLCLYHKIGVILYFNEGRLGDMVILDIQWLVDSFKYIITEPLHVRDLVEDDKDWCHFNESGYLSQVLLERIWDKKNITMNRDSHHKIASPSHSPRYGNKVLLYMQRLGLLAVGEKSHYVPCMNKSTFDDRLSNIIFNENNQKTSVLVFKFRFLPFFFYYRLIVACIAQGVWKIVEDNERKSLFKNIAFFSFKGHVIALAVSRSTIQTQIIRQGGDLLDPVVTLNIKSTIERALRLLTDRFHKKMLFSIGYQCSKQEVIKEHDKCFLLESQIRGQKTIPCPLHELENFHKVDGRKILKFWTVQELDQDGKETKEIIQKYDNKTNYKVLRKLTKIGEDALRIFFRCGI